MDLIDTAAEVGREALKYAVDSPTYKELKKIEMYIRKTYIMIRHANKLAEDDHSEETFLTDLNAALIRDQRYVKARDSLDSYSIGFCSDD